jgi:NADPH:quinone reductase-like Zn-dependent oxidoreductase
LRWFLGRWIARPFKGGKRISRSRRTPIDYQREDFTRVLPGGFDVVFDGIGENGYRCSFAALKRGGLLCAYG